MSFAAQYSHMDSVALLMIGFLVVAVATIVVLLIWLFVASLWKYGQESVDLSSNEPAVAKSTASRLHLVVRTTLLLIGILVGTVAGVSSFVSIRELMGAERPIWASFTQTSGRELMVNLVLYLGIPHLLAALVSVVSESGLKFAPLTPLACGVVSGTVCGSLFSLLIWTGVTNNMQGLNPVVFAGFAVAALAGALINKFGCVLASGILHRNCDKTGESGR